MSTSTVMIGGARVLAGSRSESLITVNNLILRSDGFRLVVTPNIQHIALLRKDLAFARAYDNASAVLCDGWPVGIVASLCSGQRVERVTGADLVYDMSAVAANHGLSVGIVGGSDGSALSAAKRLQTQFGGLRRVVVNPAGWVDLNDLRGCEQLATEVREMDCDIYFLSLGTPKQEIYADKYLSGSLNAVVFCLGAGIDFAAGSVRRAPKWMRAVGAEWLFRLILEPRRLVRRYAVSILPFLQVSIKAVVKQRRSWKVGSASE